MFCLYVFYFGGVCYITSCGNPARDSTAKKKNFYGIRSVKVSKTVVQFYDTGKLIFRPDDIVTQPSRCGADFVRCGQPRLYSLSVTV